MAAEVCVKKISDARNMYPYQYPGVTRPDVHGKVGGRSFFENLRLDNSEMLGGEEAWQKWQETLWPELEALIMRPLLLAKPALHKHEARIYGEFDGDEYMRVDNMNRQVQLDDADKSFLRASQPGKTFTRWRSLPSEVEAKKAKAMAKKKG